MIGLIKKELNTLFCSALGLFFACTLLLVTASMLWLFSGSYNILDNGYASMDNFFAIVPLLFTVLIPALTMRSFAEERRSKTYELLRSRPINTSTIFFSKLLAVWIFVVITLLPSVVYVCSIYHLSVPSGNIDLEAILGSYLSLFLLTLIFCAIGIFCSSISKNPVFSLLIAIFISVFLFYGIDLCASIFLLGQTQFKVSSLGINRHYQLMQRGVIELNDLRILLNYLVLFSLSSIYVLSLRKRIKPILISLILLLIVNICVWWIPIVRFDFTTDKRYTLSDYSKNLLHELGNKNQRFKLTVFLTGDLNPSYQQLKNATTQLTDDLNRYSNNKFIIQSQTLKPTEMERQGMPRVVVNDVSRDGKSVQQAIYPYAQIISGQDTIPIPLLRNVIGNTGEENINASIENLEFTFIDAIRIITQKKARSIAFIQGHNELPREQLQDAEVLLSKYFTVSRGQIGYNTSDLTNFRVLIIAGSKSQFNEREKYILDQYIMSGGRVLWLIDGVYYSSDKLKESGESPSMKNDTNLDDLLFNYGIRINPVLLQDQLCSPILLNMGKSDAHSTVIPCYYSPLLSTTTNNLISNDISNVKALFASSIDFVGENKAIKRRVLLTTSANSHTVRVPEMINFDVTAIQSLPHYFNQSYIPTAVSMEGHFHSAFINRTCPDSIVNNQKTLTESIKTKMVIVASSNIIQNEIIGKGDNTQVLPMGYDRLSGKQFGNRDFIVNAVNWLANDDNWMSLRSKKQQISLLDKGEIYKNRNKYVFLNISLPILLLFLIFGLVNLKRKWKWQ